MHECNTKALGKDSGETDYALTVREEKGVKQGKRNKERNKEETEPIYREKRK